MRAQTARRLLAVSGILVLFLGVEVFGTGHSPCGNPLRALPDGWPREVAETTFYIFIDAILVAYVLMFSAKPEWVVAFSKYASIVGLVAYAAHIVPSLVYGHWDACPTFWWSVLDNGSMLWFALVLAANLVLVPHLKRRAFD